MAAGAAAGTAPMRRHRGADALRGGAERRVRRGAGVLYGLPGHADVPRVPRRGVAER